MKVFLSGVIDISEQDPRSPIDTLEFFSTYTPETRLFFHEPHLNKDTGDNCCTGATTYKEWFSKATVHFVPVLGEKKSKSDLSTDQLREINSIIAIAKARQLGAQIGQNPNFRLTRFAKSNP